MYRRSGPSRTVDEGALDVACKWRNTRIAGTLKAMSDLAEAGRLAIGMHEFGLTEAQATRLRGESADEVRADAKQMRVELGLDDARSRRPWARRAWSLRVEQGHELDHPSSVGATGMNEHPAFSDALRRGAGRRVTSETVAQPSTKDRSGSVAAAQQARPACATTTQSASTPSFASCLA